MRRVTLIGGGALCLAAALLLAWLGRSARQEPERPALAVVPSPSSQSSAEPGGSLAMRNLGFRLLGLSDPEQVKAGMQTLTSAAEQGDVEAELSLGRIYLAGMPTVPRDVTRAREHFLRAESSHHPSAAYFLGVMSQNGQGVRADPREAARWFEIAAERGSPDATFLLANAYRAGAGVPKDDKKALELYEKAGELEHAPALQTLAMAYLHGELGLERDEAEYRRYMMEAEHALQHRPVPP